MAAKAGQQVFTDQFTVSGKNADISLGTKDGDAAMLGRDQPNLPHASVERVRDHLTPLYQKFGKAEDCRIDLFDCAHEELPEMRKLVLEWMDKHLVNG